MIPSFLLSSTFFILVNFISVHMLYTFFLAVIFCIVILEWCNSTKLCCTVLKCSTINHCPCETSFQVQRFGRNHSNIIEAGELAILKTSFWAFPLKKLRDLAVLMAWAPSLCAICTTGQWRLTVLQTPYRNKWARSQADISHYSSFKKYLSEATPLLI